MVPAAGRGTRFGAPANPSPPKQYARLLGATVLEWSLHSLLREPRVDGIVVVLAADDPHWAAVAASLESAEIDGTKIHTAIGGGTRQDSVLSGLRALEGRAAAEDWVLVHDAARPCLTLQDLTALIDTVMAEETVITEETVMAEGGSGMRHGALLAAPVVDTVKREHAGIAVDTVDRSSLWRALTPQVFGYARLKQALSLAAESGVAATDEAQAMERLGSKAALVSGSPFNIKVTRAEDLIMAETILQSAERDGSERDSAERTSDATRMRVGQGFDVHAFGVGDHVILGGVRIEYSKGVVAHSDGDVVIHALCDAVLGALGQGDIGQHFPDTDPRYRGADSRVFLREVARLMREASLALVNADVTVLAEAPRIAKHRAAMAANLGEDLGVPAAQINIKATTTERLGFIGRSEGLAASAAVLLAPR